MNLVIDFYRREERLRRTIRELADLPGALTLDVGCRKGELTRSLAAGKRHVVAVDIRPFEQWRDPAPHITFLGADAARLPFEDGCFDLVVSGECLQYVSDWRQALDEFHRVLRPDGRLVFSCPNGNRLIDILDPYNVLLGIKKLLRPSAMRHRSRVKHLPPAEVLDHCSSGWRRETFRRRGSLAFIYCAFLVDNLQKGRARLSRGFRERSWIADRVLRPLIELLFRVMKLDCRLRLGAFSYNAIYRFRKK